ncbi:hypothetical protein [Herbaspirillum rhizosphaerae]|uniref:hypothetical protein n=1 Tax=Herbaspirillum rhizosphaerae TaxID=346179 RepID=UPI00067BAFF5|nr:hypothetical protein [Herbaspirillum rhizosphaerae]
MRKNHVLFNWPISEVDRLSDSQEAENFVGTLSADASLEAIFISLTEEMRGIRADLVEARVNNTTYSNWPTLLQNVKTFETHFPHFPNAAYRKLKVFILLASMLYSTGAVLDQITIDESLFETRDLAIALPLRWFGRENVQSLEKSLLVIGCDDFSLLEQEFQAATTSLSPDLVFHVLGAIAQGGEFSSSHICVIKRSQGLISDDMVRAFVSLHVLAQGKKVHIPRRYVAAPQTGNLDSIDPLVPYHQWGDVLEVLSEYNSRDEPLLKFLTIYHVVENFMFKRPIVQLERQQGGQMFSIRDFRRLYDHVDMYEGPALTKMFAAVFPIPASGATIESRILTRWQALPTQAPVADIEHALYEMGINKSHSAFVSGQAAPGFFSDLVYKMRCAIVHNKETEFHMTYASLTTGFIALIESFLLPSLEELCFTLIGTPNAQLWYSNQNMKLY